MLSTAQYANETPPGASGRVWEASDGVPAAQTLTYLGLAYRLDGREAWLLCPLHEEATPSCKINLFSGVWFCHGCQQGGRFEDLIARIVGDPISALGVIRRARGSAAGNGSVPSVLEPSADLKPVDPLVRWRRFKQVNWVSADESEPVCAYLLGRGFWRSTLDAFDVRLTDWEEYPVAFPLLEKDTIVGYVRRRITDGEPKYFYNAGFDAKSRVAYFSVDDSVPCLLVEGVLDMMKAAQYGAKRIAAMLGWRVSEQKCRILGAFGVKRVVCATDNTPTGEQGWDQVRAYFNDAVRFRFPAWRKDVGELQQHEFWAGMP